MHSAAVPPADVSPVAHAVHPSVAVVAPVALDYSSAAQVLSVHTVTFPPAENPPFAQTTHPPSTALAPLAVSVNSPAGQTWSRQALTAVALAVTD